MNVSVPIENMEKINEDNVFVVETNIDDMTGEDLGYILNEMQDLPFVLDVSVSPLLMKKGRPGWLIRVITTDDMKVARFLLKNTSTFGVRVMNVIRHIGGRKMMPVKINIGGKDYEVRVKIKILDNEIIGWKVEFSDLIVIRKETRLPLIEIRRFVEGQVSFFIDKNIVK